MIMGRQADHMPTRIRDTSPSTMVPTKRLPNELPPTLARTAMTENAMVTEVHVVTQMLEEEDVFWSSVS